MWIAVMFFVLAKICLLCPTHNGAECLLIKPYSGYGDGLDAVVESGNKNKSVYSGCRSLFAEADGKKELARKI